MDLKGILSTKDKEELEYYWALVVEPGWVQAGAWRIKEGSAEVIKVSSPAAWGADEELISAADTTLSSAVQNLPEEAGEPSKTVFGVPSSWVSEGEIKKEYLEKIKRLCSDLSLEPVGFVIISEAIAHMVKTKEGSPLSATVLGIAEDNIEVAVFRLGNLVGTSLVARSVSVIDDVVEGLTRFSTNDPLPSRFLLYNGREAELEEAKQALLKAQWDDFEKIKFLHTPKIETVNPDEKVLATALAGASEIEEIASVTAAEKREGEEEEEEIVEEKEEVKEEKRAKAEDVGFVVGEDVAKTRPSVAAKEEVPREIPTKEPPEPEPDGKRAPKEKFSHFNQPAASSILGRAKGVASSVFKEGRQMKPGFFGTRKATFVSGGLLVLVILSLFLAWWFLPKATVTVYVAPRKIDERITILMDTDASSPDFSEGILPGKMVATSVSGERTKSTTGTRTVGERAKGTVKIQNGTPSTIQLSSGTILIAANDLRFNLDTSASVSAALSPSSPGTATVDVTAGDIGAEYNLGKDETFKVGNYPKAEVDAVATSDLSGGSSRDIAAVSEEDQEALLDELTEELLDKARDELTATLSEEEFLIEESMESEAGDRSFSDKVDDEASTLKLSLTLSVDALVVNRTNLTDLAKEVLKDRIPSGYVLREKQIDLGFELAKKEEGIYEFLTSIDANLLPEVKDDEVRQKIVGRYSPVAQDYLTSIPGFTRAEIAITPTLPGRLGTLPHVAGRIEVEVAAER